MERFRKVGWVGGFLCFRSKEREEQRSGAESSNLRYTCMCANALFMK
jgi:hypothetical protein